MEDKEILDTLKELKESTAKISKMLQIILYNMYGDDDPDDDPPEKKFLHKVNVNELEEVDIQEKYKRSYLG